MEQVRFSMCEGPPPEPAGKILDREIPSDLALVTPLVVRTLEALAERGVLKRHDEPPVSLALEEALRNAVLHGNRQRFSKKVRLEVFHTDSELGFLISDEGSGFDPKTLRDPTKPEHVLEETGRGIPLMCHFMGSVKYYRNGSVVHMARKVSSPSG